MNDTLLHGTHYACAVGNMIQHRKLVQLRNQIGLANLLPALKGDLLKADPYALALVRMELRNDWFDDLHHPRMDHLRKSMVHGYSINELKDIDDAFSSFNSRNDKDGFLGLNAVFNVLCKIHRESPKKVVAKK